MRTISLRVMLAAALGIAATVLGTGFLGQILYADIPPISDGPPLFCVDYDHNAALDPATTALYQDISTLLYGYNVIPANRLTFYSAVNNANGCTISGWQAIISDVQANANGNLVTLAVLPTLVSNDYGAGSVVFGSDYSEQFQVNNDGTFQYVGSLDPLGHAGQLPAIVGF